MICRDASFVVRVRAYVGRNTDGTAKRAYHEAVVEVSIRKLNSSKNQRATEARKSPKSAKLMARLGQIADHPSGAPELCEITKLGPAVNKI